MSSGGEALEQSLLLTAARTGADKEVQKLLNKNVNVCCADEKGYTPLHHAAQNDREFIVRMLLEAGADTTIRNKDGKTARGVAKSQNVAALLDDRPVRVQKVVELEEHSKRQAAPTECDPSRKDICEYFKGHIRYWHDDMNKDAEPSVLNILYGGSLAQAEKDLQQEFTKQRDLKKNLPKEKSNDGPKMAQAKKKDEEKKKNKEKKEEEWKGQEASPEQPKEDPKKEDITKKANRWIHLPANNRVWVEHLVEKLCAEDGKTETECKDIQDFIANSFYEHRGQDSGSSFRQPLLYTHPSNSHMMSFVIPFIDADTISIVNQNGESSDQKNPTRACRFEYMRKMEKDEKYASKLHPARLLDRSYYDEDMSEKDCNQVIARYRGEKVIDENISILMIKQLWLWTVDARTIITTSPVRYQVENTFTLQNSITRDLEGRRIFTLEDFVKHVVVRTVDFIEDPSKAGLEQQCFDVYSHLIGKVAGEVITCYDNFKQSIDPDRRNRDKSKRYGIAKEYQHLVEIRDILDEINILQPIFTEQHSMTKRLLAWVESKNGSGRPKRRNRSGHTNRDPVRLAGKINEQKTLQKWENFTTSDKTYIRQRRVQWLEREATKSLKSIHTLLNLKQQQASIDLAESAATQGKAILAFTTVTIIFVLFLDR